MSFFTPKEQQQATGRKRLACVLFVCLLIGLSACGKKPSYVDPPASAKGESTYPRPYPAPDPALERKDEGL